MRRWLFTLTVFIAITAGFPVTGGAACIGDCDGSGMVTADELVAAVGVALGAATTLTCPAGYSDGRITVDAIITAVNLALNHCPAAEGPVALFSANPDSADNPFPSERLLDATGHVRISSAYLDPGLPPTSDFDAARSYLQSIAAQLHALTGFGTYASLRVRFDRPVQVAVKSNSQALLLLKYPFASAAVENVTVTFDATDNALEIQPVLPLQPKTRYALIVTTAVTDSAGHPARPSADFAALLAGNGLPPELGAYRTLVQPAIDAAHDRFGIGSDGLALVDVFTTEAISDDLLTIRDRLHDAELTPGPPVFDNSPIPDFETGIFAEGTTGFQHLVGSRTSTNLSAVAAGSFDSYDFRSGPSDGFDADLVSGRNLPPVNHLDFYVTIPKAAAPPQGYPVVIFAHGLSGSGRDVFNNLPRTIEDAPLIGLAISALHNGLRGEPATFFTFDTIAATREYIRQTVADLLQLERMLRNAHSAGTPPFDRIDPDHIVYMGGSLGAIIGTLYMAVEPDVRVAMLSVPGGGLPAIIQSPTLIAFINPLLAEQSGLAEDSPFFPSFVHRLQPVLQWAWDPADPINYAPYVRASGAQLPGVAPKQVLMHEGIVDTLVPKATTDALASVMQLPDASLTNGCNDLTGCSGIWRFVMKDFGQPEFFGHGVTTAIPQARKQAGEFLSSFGTVITDARP